MSVNIYDDTQGTLTRVDGVADIAFKTDLIELTSVSLNSVGYSGLISNAIPSVQ